MGEKKGDAMCSAKTVTFGGVVAYPKAPAAGAIEPTKARFNCIGTLRDSLKMVGSNGSKFLTVRLVRSKLRKREETAVAAATAAAATAVTTANGTAAAATTAVTVNNNSISNNNNVDCQLPVGQHQQQQAIDLTGVPAVDVVDASAPGPLPFLWQYSAKNAAAAKNNNNGAAAANGYNSPYRLYNSDQVNEKCFFFFFFSLFFSLVTPARVREISPVVRRVLVCPPTASPAREAGRPGEPWTACKVYAGRSIVTP